MNICNLLKGEITQVDLLNYHNATVMYYELPLSIKGFVFAYDNIKFIIINKLISYYQKKKTLLHELAHLELNQLCQIDKDLFAFHINEYEDDADRYIRQIKEKIKYV